jgi:hypothetical protein
MNTVRNLFQDFLNSFKFITNRAVFICITRFELIVQGKSSSYELDYSLPTQRSVYTRNRVLLSILNEIRVLQYMHPIQKNFLILFDMCIGDSSFHRSYISVI